MAAGGNFVAPLFRQGIIGQQDGGPVDALPTYYPPQETAGRSNGAEEAAPSYPLSLISPKAHAFMNSQYGNMDKQVGQQGPQACRLNPVDAEARGITDRSLVRIYNDRSEIRAMARSPIRSCPAWCRCRWATGHQPNTARPR